MNETAWLPSLLVLGVGLAIGIAATFALRRSRRGKPAEAESELRLRDLEERRDDLYRRLRAEDLSAGDRESLELAAAHTLKELDRLAAERPRGKPSKPAAAPAPPASPAAAPAAGIRHPALVGFVAGMAVVLLVGWLVYLAMRDSGAATATPPATPAAAGSAEAPHPESGSLPEEVRRELERLEAAARAAPGELLAQKRLALGRLDAGLFFEAFSDAEAILAGRPEDPDGLYIQGVVRLSMGRTEEALELLDRVLASYPDHLRAMVYRGLALAQGGDLEQAIATWELALEMSGGNPEIENLIRQARAQPPPPTTAAVPPAAPAAQPPATAAAPAPAPAPAPEPAPPAAPATAGPAYDVTVELAAGRSVPPGAVLFVFLRPGEAGPPVAVKRIPTPRFPLRLALGADDAMMAGTELPAQGNLVARLSASGNAQRSPNDLEASSPAALGQPVQLVLGGS